MEGYGALLVALPRKADFDWIKLTEVVTAAHVPTVEIWPANVTASLSFAIDTRDC